jgi:hypothetical protein
VLGTLQPALSRPVQGQPVAIKIFDCNQAVNFVLTLPEMALGSSVAELELLQPGYTKLQVVGFVV